MKDLQKKITSLIIACVVALIGIFCIIAGATNDLSTASTASDGLDLTLGISFVAIAGIAIVLALVMAVINKKGFASIALGSASLFACGLWFLVDGGVLAIICMFLGYVKFLLIVVGSILALDAILTFVFNIKNAKAYLVSFIIALVIAVTSIVLGCLMLGNNPVISGSAQLIVFGIIVCLVALYICATALITKTVVVAVVENNAEEVETQEAKTEEVEVQEVKTEEAKDAE